MPDLIKTVRENPAKAIALFAVTMCIGFGTCGLAALSMHGDRNTLLSIVAMTGVIVFALSAVGLVMMLVAVLIRVIKKAHER